MATIAPALQRFIEARSAEAVRASIPLGVQACAVLADSLDEAVRELAAPVAQSGFALVALGSYGRRELCRHSDVDLMVLVNGTNTEATNAVLYPLWDASLKVGHSVRTPDQAAEAARQNVETFTSILDARLICGDEALYGRFLDARRKVARSDRGAMRRELNARHEALLKREPFQLQEPDVKTGRGGLREQQMVYWLWLAEAIAEDQTPPPVEPEIALARDTLLVVRNALHALQDRGQDRYRQDLSVGVAELLEKSRSDVGRRLFLAMRAIDRQAARAFIETPSSVRLLRRVFGRPGSSQAPLTPLDQAEPQGDDLSMVLGTLQRDAPGLDPMPESLWLERILPEWDVVRALPHIAPFHRHPVDVHIWRTVAEARYAMFEDTENTGTIDAALELANKDELLLAALLHDIGKGHEGDHSSLGAVIAERFASRVGLDAEATRRLVVTAQHHLLLPTVATRRDIADERVIREVAETIGDVQTLHLLYIIGVADARASGPDVWNPWKATLMRSLYSRVLDHLSQTAPEKASASERARQAVLTALEGRFEPAAVLAHLHALPPTYLLSMPPEVVAQHLDLIAAAAGAPGSTAMGHDRLGDMERLTIVTRDRPGILSLVAGTLAVHNVNVLGGTAYTRDDGVAIEVMFVNDGLGHDIDERRWGRVNTDVPLALTGEFPLDERLAQTRSTYDRGPAAAIETTVHIDNNGSDKYTIVEVNAPDRIGLLYSITHALHGLSLDIHLAKVDTVGHEIVDAFYVLRENGRRVEAPDEVARLQQRVIAAVAALS